MCGIAGQIRLDNAPVDSDLLQEMAHRLQHRGPDDEGFFQDGSLGLAFRRLSIIDLESGHQPIANEDGTIWLVCNGEIYNFVELRDSLLRKGHKFRSRSDVEVIVHLYEETGPRCVESMNGMFAFALWDSRSRRLLLARDRVGKKPLFYYHNPRSLTFASELQALLSDPQIPRHVDPVALAQYLQFWYIPAPRTIFQGVRKLPPASILLCDSNGVQLERYWDLDFAHKETFPENEWAERILDIAQDAVRIRLMSDVPLGALLSGGLDSSTIVALMSRLLSEPVRTFSIGFEEDAYNELPYARQVAICLGTDHREEIVRPNATQVLPMLLRHYGEPFGDDSCIPTYYLAQLARQQVKVALSGDGGDEAFGGYPRLWQYLTFRPGNSLYGLVVEHLKGICGRTRPPWASHNGSLWKDFVRELAFRVEEICRPVHRYAHAWIVWKGGLKNVLSQDVVAHLREDFLEPWKNILRKTKGWHPLDRLLYLDICTYLPGDLQTKMDIASMAASLEVRSPLLDYRILELTAAMPSAFKQHDRETKILFRRAIRSLLPTEIVQRGKQGFGMPISEWLRGQLRPMVQDMLLSDRGVWRDYFRPATVENMLQEHLAGHRDWGRHLWLLLCFEVWARTFLNGDRP
ncbi:MAG: asparagine synthase (glutamine-hydrolyzing) [Candidatus Micrarchaeaceae archaeon]